MQNNALFQRKIDHILYLRWAATIMQQAKLINNKQCNIVVLLIFNYGQLGQFG